MNVLQQTVSKILWENWDPLCMKIWDDAPRDEYDSYVLPLIEVLFKGGGSNEVIAYLDEIERDRMGQEPVAERNAKVAELCVAAYQQHLS